MVGVSGRRSGKMQQSYWARGVNWIEGLLMRVRGQEEAKCGVSHMASV